MKPHLFAAVITLIIIALAENPWAAEPPATTSLADAIQAFNEEASKNPVGKSQPPLTLDEVVAAILLYEKPADAPVSENLLQSFKAIATSGELPGNAEFEKLTGYDRGGDRIFTVWSVRIRLARADGSSYAFRIRERVLGSRTLEEEIARLDQVIIESKAAEMPGGYRLFDRKEELETRIAKITKEQEPLPEPK